MKNNKGMTIVEIIVSITLISIILVFLLNLLITVKNANDQTKASSDLLINQSLITKAIQNDFNNLNLVGISVCDKKDLSDKTIIPNSSVDDSTIYCLKLIYDSTKTQDDGYLLQYKYKYNNENERIIVGYKRGTNQVMRESPSINSDEQGTVTSSCSNNNHDTCSLKIVMPVIGNDTNHYNIELSYIYNIEEFSYTFGNDYRFDIE